MTTLTRADWEQRAKNLQIEGRALIHGEHRDAVSGQTFECVSPVDGRVLGLIASCDAADADVAVRDARATFESGVWSRMKPVERKKIMIRFADLLDAHAEELALLETLDMGKPIAFSLSVDVAGASRAIRWTISGALTALRPCTKKVAGTWLLASTLSSFGVTTGSGPSSNVSEIVCEVLCA